MVALLTSLSANAYDAYIDGIYYNIVAKTKKAKVTGGNNNYSGEVIIPSAVTYNDVTYDVTGIEGFAFQYCSRLTSIDIPSSVTKIGDNAFCGCIGLTSVSIPEGVAIIGGNAFYGCTGLTSITIPSSVTNIEIGAFFGCRGLTSVTIPEGVTSIGSSAFNGCSGLTSVIISSNVTSIGVYAFEGCTALTSVIIPSSVTSIGAFAFDGCTGLTSVTISSSVTSIGGYAFQGCTALTSVTIPSSVTGIGEYAFHGCTALTSVTIPSSVTKIGDNAFMNCSCLASVTIEGTSSIGHQSFVTCPTLLDVYCNSETPPTTYSDAFENSSIDYVTLHVPANALSAYTNDSFWGNSFKEIVTIDAVEFPTTITLTDGEAFEGLGIERDMETITYTRTFANTNWQGLYVPFTMEYSEWEADFDIARINDIHQFDDDDNGIKVTSGSIEANTPYLIRAKEAGEKTFTLANRTLYKAEEKSYTVSSWNTLFTFTGTYSGVTGSDMVGNAYYALGAGVLRQTASTDNALSPYRWYVAITDRNGAQKGVNEVKLKVWGEDATGISPLSVSPEGRKTAVVYDLSGRRVERIQKGIYVINGKKVLK